MDRICHPRSHSSTIDVADARYRLRAQFPCRSWLAENHYSTTTTTSIDVLSEDSNYRKPLRAITTRNLGAGAFMKGEMLRGVDGRIFRQGTGLELGRGQTIYHNHRHSGAIPGNTPDDVFSCLGIDIEAAQGGKRQQEQVEHEAEASSGGHWKTLAPIRKSGCIPDFSDSRVYGRDTVTIEGSWYNGYPRSDALDTQQADEMFNLFINVDECEDIMI